MKSVRTENRSYCASPATITAEFRCCNSWSNPMLVVEVTVPPPATGGRFRFEVRFRFANHTYGARLKVQPDGLAAGCAGVAGCCAWTPDATPTTSNPVKTPAITIRRNIRRPPCPNMVSTILPDLAKRDLRQDGTCKQYEADQHSGCRSAGHRGYPMQFLPMIITLPSRPLDALSVFGKAAKNRRPLRP